MSIPPTACLGSLTAIADLTSSASTAVCPVCGARLPVGYGLRLPVHQHSQTTAATSRAEGGRPAARTGEPLD